MTWKMEDLTASTSAPLGTFSPATYVFQGTQHVIHQGFTSAQGSDGSVHELYWDNGTWNHHDLTLQAGAPSIGLSQDLTGYAFTAQGTQHVDYTGQDGHVHELYWNSNDDWQHRDLTLAAGAQLASSGPTGYEFRGQHVVYVGDDRHVHKLEWDNGNNSWHDSDLTIIAGAVGVPTLNQLAAYVCEFQPTQHIVYLGTDDHVHELSWDQGVWSYTDLTATANAPLANFSPIGYSFNYQGTQHVAYGTTDGHAHDLQCAAGVWQHSDLTAIVGSAYGAPSTGYNDDSEETQYINYVGTDRHIHELGWDHINGWKYSDLTAHTFAPLAISGPKGYVFPIQGSRNAVYLSEDHHMIRLYWLP